MADALTGNFTSGQTHTGVVKVTGNNYTVTDLVTINAANEGGEINLNDRSVALTEQPRTCIAALAGNFTNNQTHTGVVTISDNGTTVNATDITAIETAKGSGNINITNGVALSGTGAKLKSAAEALDTIHATTTATVTDTSYTVAQLKAINDKVGGAITLSTTNVSLTGSAADLKDALAGSFTSAHTGTVKVTGTYNVSQLKAINAGTDGTIHLANRTCWAYRISR